MTDLADLTWPDVRDLAGAGAVLAIPLGATEQHGPHLPLSTDTDIAVELCGRLAAVRADVLVAPPVAYGSSGEHADFAGTLSIGQDAVELVLVELVRSAMRTFRRVLVVSAHGGNVEPAARAVRALRAESRDVRMFTPNYGGDAHAGWSETAIQLAIRPMNVWMNRARPGDTRPLAELMPVLRATGVRTVSPSGVLGDPTGACADEGRVLLDLLTGQLMREMDAWAPAMA
ncbi:MAG TPA: mycofactocin biosynthesis peptidyl-dipeptidase MftE [Pseudonocardiaceae bacterium]